MSRKPKVTNRLESYVLDKKRLNPDIGCRSLAQDVSDKFKITISKSRISEILKGAGVSSPVGRRGSQQLRFSGQLEAAGYCFLYAANSVFKISDTIASMIASQGGQALARLFGKGELETITEAWLLSKAIYNVPLEKIENYSKNEMWFITGRRVNKGLLRRYVKNANLLQDIANKSFIEFSTSMEDVLGLKFSLADGSSYVLDGQRKSIWPDKKLPLDFNTTLNIANSYINSMILGQDPVTVFNARPQGVLGDEFFDFIFSFEGGLWSKKVEKVELISPSGQIIREIPFEAHPKRGFVIGIWPWHHKLISELARKPAKNVFVLEPFGLELRFLEDRLKFTQLVANKEVILRTIILNEEKEGPAQLAVVTNLDEKDWGTTRVLETYFRNFPDLKNAHKYFLTATKTPTYLDDYLSASRVLHTASGLKDARNFDDFFSILVETLSVLAKKIFFPSGCSGWSTLKMKEKFYKRSGHIKRDLPGGILYNIFTSNKIEDNMFLEYACMRFNELPVCDFCGKKIWVSLLPQKSS